MSMAIAPSFALGEGNRNLFLIGVMLISPLLILKDRRFYLSDIWLLFFMLSIVLIPPLANPESMRWSTVMYSIMFGLTFIAYKQILYQESFTVDLYLKLLKYLIFSYFVVLLIQQFCVLTGLPIFNLSNYDPLEPWKLNSLAAEPSHSARIIPLLMFCYITVKELDLKRKYNFALDGKQDKWVWVAFLWPMVTMGSGTAFLFMAIVLLKFIRFKNLIPLFILFGLIIFLVNIFDITAFERTLKTFTATLSLDTKEIIQADHSASIRIVPMMFLSERMGLTSLNDWFGYGIDYTSYYLNGKIPGVPDGFTGGGLVSFLVEYGWISFFLFLLFSLSSIMRKGDYFSLVFWFMLVFLSTVNSQILWLCIILLFTNKYFEKTYFDTEPMKRGV